MFTFIPYLIIMTAVILFGWTLSRTLPFYKKVLNSEEKGRYEMLDGLRGVLAFGVFFQHSITNLAYFKTGIWTITDEKFFRYLGGEAVIMFFMITSFLYWSKAINKKGDVNILSLYINRILRLAPMYLFSAGVVTIMALYVTNFDFSQPITLVKNLLSWLTLGIQTTKSVNGISIFPFNAGIHWTLHFEWIFYLILPIAALALTKTPLRFIAIPIFSYILLSPYRGYWMIFIFGIIAAHVVEKYATLPWLKGKIAALIPIIGLIIVYLMSYKPYSFGQYAVTLVVLLCFIYGNSLFGILQTRGAKFLGIISYSIYLLHGIVIYLVLSIVNRFYVVGELSPLSFWLLILISSFIVVIISSLTYQYVEYPFIRRIENLKKVK